jgi:hypothetical protein
MILTEHWPRSVHCVLGIHRVNTHLLSHSRQLIGAAFQGHSCTLTDPQTTDLRDLERAAATLWSWGSRPNCVLGPQ